MDQKLHTLDWIVIVAYGMGMLAVGWYFSRRTRTSEDYMLGGRNMKPWAVGFSLFATMLSAISYLAYTGEMIKYGPMIFCGLFSLPFIYIIVGWLLIPSIMKLKIASAHELLEIHLGVSLRILASIIFIFMRLIWMSVIIYMCAQKVIVPIMGWSEDAALWVSIIMGVVTVIYTSMGGLRAVVVTDVVQTFVLLAAAILSIILITKHTGGVSGWFPKKFPDTWLAWTFFDTKARASFMTAFIAMFSFFICTAGSDQMAVQRYLATRNVKAARTMYLTSLIVNTVVVILLAIFGLALLGYFSANQHLLFGGETIADSADKLLPYFILIGLPKGITGLAIAGLLAAAMSSLSSGINSSCLVISQDFIIRFRKEKISESRQVILAKIISVGIGVAVVLLSLVVGKVKGNLLEMTYKTINLLVAPLFVPFFMALFVRRATEFGTFVGTLASLIIAVLISYSSEIFGRSIPFLWIIPASFVGGVMVSAALSFLWPDRNEHV